MLFVGLSLIGAFKSPVPSILRKWRACIEQVQDTEEYYQELCTRIGLERVAQYCAEEARLQVDRDSNVEVMDSIDVKDDKGLLFTFELMFLIDSLPLAPGKAKVQLQLAEAESEMTSDVLPGSAAWIAFGLKLEEQQ